MPHGAPSAEGRDMPRGRAAAGADPDCGSRVCWTDGLRVGICPSSTAGPGHIPTLEAHGAS